MVLTPDRNSVDVQRKKILVVDDNVDILESLEAVLKLRNFEVATLTEGTDVVEFVRREKPDLIVLDIMIPKPNGYQLCYMLKNNRDLNHIPIVLLSAKSDPMDIQLGFRMGADGYLTKPYENTALFDQIHRLLK